MTKAAERALARRLRRFGETMIRELRPRKANATLAVTFLSNAALRALKREHLGKTASFVNVLAFPAPKGFPLPDRPSGFLGDVYLNRVYLSRPPAELVFMLIHGMLHLLGYRHDRKRDTIRMERLEDRLMNRFRFSGRTFRVLPRVAR